MRMREIMKRERLTAVIQLSSTSCRQAASQATLSFEQLQARGVYGSSRNCDRFLYVSAPRNEKQLISVSHACFENSVLNMEMTYILSFYPTESIQQVYHKANVVILLEKISIFLLKIAIPTN
jgi:hypothetical protein